MPRLVAHDEAYAMFVSALTDMQWEMYSRCPGPQKDKIFHLWLKEHSLVLRQA